MRQKMFLLLIIAWFFLKAGYVWSGAPFIRKQGTQLLVDTNTAITLQGVNLVFDRMVLPDGSWAIGTCDVLNQFPSTTPVTNWYSESHLQTLAGIGFNVIRMNLQYRIFEDDSNPGVYKQSGWNFLDTYVQWAANQNLYLILDMHIPPGGIQAGGSGACLWDAASNQTRLVDLWKAIAQRYANESRIAAYDILNEPTPTGTTLQNGVGKWQTLAQQIVDSIRTVDSNHLIIVERVNWITNADGSSPLSDWSTSVLNAFQITVSDANTIYDFHFYDPVTYALQNEGSFPDDGNYPDVNSSERARDGTLMPRDKNYLAHEFDLEIRGTDPMFVGEWSPNPSTFNTTKGGYTYIQNVLDLMKQRGLNWTYYAVWNLYTIDCCTEGVVCCSGENTTTPAYQALIDLFTSYYSVTSVPVELSAFAASVVENGVILEWQTETETNNFGFDIERKEASNWKTIGFLAGHGTTTQPQHYEYLDMLSHDFVNGSATRSYRLKQIDTDGSFEYSPVVQVTLGLPETIQLLQNYPNPFNPETSIHFLLPTRQKVTLRVVDILGNQVTVLVDGILNPGEHSVVFRAAQLPSGVYFYQLQAGGGHVETKKFLLLR